MMFAKLYRVVILSALWVPAATAAQIGSPPGLDPTSSEGFKSKVYRTVGSIELKLHILFPADHRPSDRRAAIVFFFGGGWKSGSANQFIPQCRHLSGLGLVAITADYRVFERHAAKVVDCVADAQAAIRWVRAHAEELGIDPDRIVASGGSAGGHLAAATAMLDDFTKAGDGKAVSFRPNALVLFNPALDLTPEGLQSIKAARSDRGVGSRLGAAARDLSPADHIKPHLPPTLIFHGRDDKLIPFSQMEDFVETMKAAGNRCELVGFAGQGHGFFNYRAGNSRFFMDTMRRTEAFLRDLGYIKQQASATRPAGDR